MMTVSAVAKLIPKPPALVLRRNAKSVDVGELKWSMACYTQLPISLSPSSQHNSPIENQLHCFSTLPRVKMVISPDVYTE